MCVGLGTAAVVCGASGGAGGGAGREGADGSFTRDVNSESTCCRSFSSCDTISTLLGFFRFEEVVSTDLRFMIFKDFFVSKYFFYISPFLLI